jgi:HPr kinase/phosphorylase
MPSPKVTVAQLLERLRVTLQLEEMEPGTGLDRTVGNPEVSSPGLVLAGYVKRVSAGRLQVLGETEITYLTSLAAADRKKILELFFSFPIPAVFVTTGLRLPTGL